MPKYRYPITSLALLALVASTGAAQTRAVTAIPSAAGAAYATPLHLPTSHFEFVAGDTPPLVKPIAVHNGGNARFTDVRVVRVVYADSARGSSWLVASPRQTIVAPDELATVGALCVDAADLKPGTYRATAAIAAREVPEPVAITITLVVKNPRAGARSAAHCGAAVKKS